jgi:hypothetical protein
VTIALGALHKTFAASWHIPNDFWLCQAKLIKVNDIQVGLHAGRNQTTVLQTVCEGILACLLGNEKF